VLQNWLAEAPNVGCSISVASMRLKGRKIFVYAGNMGVAQGMDVLLDLADSLRRRADIGFLLVGRGSDAQRLREEASARKLDNVAFFDEIEPSEIPGLYAQCHVGLVTLDPRHKTHNIPGKFLSYMQSGLPVLASINPGNDLADLIVRERVGRVCTDASAQTLGRLAEDLADAMLGDVEIRTRCKALAAKLFSPETAVRQIVQALAR
jgi:glycosyltransferase involved in cell wall biosynthesis